MKKQISLNILFSLIYQFIYAISGLIVPKLLLNTFGSEVNGLISSLSGFLSFFSVVEGGMTAVIASQLYKPLVENDENTLNKVIASGKRFYKKLAIYYALFAICVAIFYPIVKHTSFSFFYIFFLVLILASIPFVSYYTYNILSTILYSDGKTYIIHISYTIAAIFNVFLIILGIKIFPNIHFVKLLSLISFIINPLLLGLYVKKHYVIDRKVAANDAIINQRWDGFAHNLSTFIMNNIDIYVLTFFSTLISVSIYSIYSVIVVSLRQLVNTITNVLTPFLGKAKAAKTNVEESFNIQIYITGLITIVIFSCTYVLLNPFVKIYTINIHDANYINPTFAFLFVTSELIACLTFPYINISYAGGDFKNTKYIAYTEVIVNVILSVILVFKFDLIGVIIATIISRLVRFIMQILYLKKNEHEINIIKSIFKIIEKVIVIFVVVFVLNKLIVFDSFSYTSWIINGFLSFSVSSLLCIAFSFVFDRKLTSYIFVSVIKNIFGAK